MRSKRIRDIIKKEFKENWLNGNDLHKTNSFYDKEYHIPNSVEELKNDIKIAQGHIENLFGISEGRINNLYTQKDIFDCDNFAFSLKTMIGIDHYRRYLDGLHENTGEYFCAVAIAKMPGLLGGYFVHAFNMFICCEHIYFYDMTNGKFWSIEEEMPNILQLG